MSKIRCPRCGTENCFGGCIPFGYAVEDSEPVYDEEANIIYHKTKVKVDLKGSKLRDPDDVMKCTRDKIEFKEWFHSEFDIEYSSLNTHHLCLFQGWMAARGWKV